MCEYFIIMSVYSSLDLHNNNTTADLCPSNKVHLVWCVLSQCWKGLVIDNCRISLSIVVIRLQGDSLGV